MTVASPAVLTELLQDIVAPDPKWLKQARAHLDSLTKPRGSLGRLEDIAARMFAIRNGDLSVPLKRAVYVFAADHGIVAEGVSAYPKEVTRQMVLNFLAIGAAINVLANLHQAELTVVDVGVDANFEQLPRLLHKKVRRGSRNMLHGDAMTEDELNSALQVGFELASAAHEQQQTLIAIGEMGIGNTTSASVITAVLTHQPAATVTGKGTGLDQSARDRKISVVEAVIGKHFALRSGISASDPIEILRRVGGLEIAAMTGMVLGAARHGIAAIADGFISTAAATLAYAINPTVKEYLFAGHRSDEPGHRFLLEYLGLDPILDLEMRLGEGTGAVLAMPIIESALEVYKQMATFASAGISGALT
ncbi:MAG: nicotinate-nucleotide/dimethylbenzimidazole phosphoribosyltransferase [Acidobacteriaceae bacterium]|jgi:nicotinate-nucleotide--dimethylbenzimidazole phosphoribosyltransferase|nr:nicotinate-nucleotide/dimethylbenzimidazole phosphoribosyltransferase [Acidobacteriaceae bacterium]